MNGPKIAMNGAKVTMNGTRSRPSSAEKDTNTCKIVLLGCPGVGKTGKWSDICCHISIFQSYMFVHMSHDT